MIFHDFTVHSGCVFSEKHAEKVRKKEKTLYVPPLNI